MKRKKIWEISSEYLCSIIGTCLTLEDVRTAFSKADVKIPEGFTDYNIHGMAVNLASDFSRFSNKVNDMLDKKHCSEIYTASKCATVKELKTFWEKSYAEGNISGAYWALISNPLCGDELLNHAFGEVHILSHIAGARERTRREELNRHMRQIDNLSEAIDSYKEKMAACNSRLKTLKKENGALRKSEQQLKQRNENLQNKLASLRSGVDKSPKMEELQSKLRGVELQYERSKQELNCLAEELELLRETNAVLQELLANANKQRCEDCDNDCEYAGTINLNKKTVLLVGGRTSSIPQYRSLVEVMNGNCIHHDGGQEESITVLQNLVPKADIIVCFLNCVSHGASNCVKKNSQGDNQRIIMLKTSGLTTFKRELEKRAV